MQIFKDKNNKSLTFSQALPKIANRLGSYFSDFWLMIVRWAGNVPSHLIRRFVYRVSGMKIGKGSTFHIGADFFRLNRIVIGEDTIIGRGCFMDGRAPIAIGSHVDIASEVMIYNSHHNVDDPDFGTEDKRVIIGDYVFIGPRVIILPGVTVGRGAVIGAGAVVAKDIGEKEVVGGVPAQKIRDRKVKELNYRLGRARLFQ